MGDDVRIDEFQSQVEKLTADLAFMHEKYDELTESFNNEKDTLSKEWEEKFTDVERQNNSAVEKLKVMEEEYCTNISHMQNKLDEAYRSISSKKEMLVEKDNTIVDLAEQLKGMTSCKNDIETKLTSVISENEKVFLKIQEELKEKVLISEKLNAELESKCEVIKSMNLSQTKLNELINDKNAVIESQSLIIEGMRHKSESIKELEEIKCKLSEKESEISKLKIYLEKTQDPGDVETLIRQIKMERETNTHLTKRIEDQIVITEKTESTLKALEDLVATKSLLIENLQILNTHQDKQAEMEISNLTSHNDTDVSSVASSLEKENGVMKNAEISSQENSTNEALEFIKAHAENGVIVNGFLLWVDIQRKATPENIWKDQAMKRFIKEEISEAKKLLWKTFDEDIIGKLIKRQGASKLTSEVNDIAMAFKTLSERDTIPIIIGTSDMVALTPIYKSHPTDGDQSEVNFRLKAIEESMSSMMESKATVFPVQAQNETNASDVESDTASNKSFGGGFDSDTDQDGFSVFHKKKSRKDKNADNGSWRGKLNTIRGTSRR